MKKSNIIGKVKALGQKQVIKKRQLASKIEKTAEKLKKERVSEANKKPDIGKILKDNNLKFSRYNKPVQLVYDRDSNKTDKVVINATLSKDKKSILVRTKGVSGIRVNTLDVSPVGSKLKVKTKKEKEAEKKAEDEKIRKISKPAKQPPKKPKVINDTYSKIIKDFPSVVSIKKQPNSQGVEILTKRGANLKIKETNEIFRRVRDILTDKGEPFQLGMSEEKEKAKPKPPPPKEEPKKKSFVDNVNSEVSKRIADKKARKDAAGKKIFDDFKKKILAKPAAKPKAKPPPPKEDSDSEVETPDPPLKKIPKNIYNIWKKYMEDRVGNYYTKSDQEEEVEVFEDLEKDYIKNDKIRKNKKEKAAAQSKARNILAKIRDDMNLDFKENPNYKNLYEELAPKLLQKYEDFNRPIKEKDEEFNKELIAKEKKDQADEEARIVRIKGGSKPAPAKPVAKRLNPDRMKKYLKSKSFNDLPQRLDEGETRQQYFNFVTSFMDSSESFSYAQSQQTGAGGAGVDISDMDPKKLKKIQDEDRRQGLGLVKMLREFWNAGGTYSKSPNSIINKSELEYVWSRARGILGVKDPLVIKTKDKLDGKRRAKKAPAKK